MATRHNIDELEESSFWRYFNAFLLDAKRRLKSKPKEYGRLVISTDALYIIMNISDTYCKSGLSDNIEKQNTCHICGRVTTELTQTAPGKIRLICQGCKDKEKKHNDRQHR